MNIFGLLIQWLVISVSLIIISKLPTGIEIDSFKNAAIWAVLFGILNAIIRPLLQLFTLPLTLIFSGFLVSLVLNMIIFLIASSLVEGFKLRSGAWTALIGSVSLSIVSALIYKILPF
jgi:putative membrane protein